MHADRQVTTIIQDQVRLPAVRAFDGLVNAPPEFFLTHALPGKNRNAAGRNRRRRMILGRENIAGRPAHFRAKGRQRFDQNRRLDGHMQAPDDAGPFQDLFFSEFFAQGHQARHLDFSEFNFLATPSRQRDVLDFKVVGHGSSLHCLSERCPIAPVSSGGHIAGEPPPGKVLAFFTIHWSNNRQERKIRSNMRN